MIELALTSLGLGLAGVDPAGLVVALGALAAGTRERLVIAFALIAVVGTALLGIGLTLTLGQQLQEFEWSSLLPPDWLAATIELVLAAGLLLWAALRVRRPGIRPPRPAGRSRSGTALLWAGVMFALSAPLDPTFLGLVVIAGRGEPVTAVASAHLIWIVVSQLPLVALVLIILLRRHARPVAWLQTVMPKARPVLAKVSTAALAFLGGVLAIDAGWWFVTARFLLPDPT